MPGSMASGALLSQPATPGARHRHERIT